jgi:SAM-dependent methyltransferase
VLEIGAAAGFTLRAFRDAGWQCSGLEPNATMAEHAREQLGIPVEAASFESWDASQCSDQPFDALLMLQVLAHFVDPRLALIKSRELLHSGGHLLVESWDRASFAARFAGKTWHEYSPPSVLHWFSRQEVGRLARNCGFEVVSQGRPTKWIEAGHARSLLEAKAGQSRWTQVLAATLRFVPDHAALPYPSDDLFWMLLRRAA